MAVNVSFEGKYEEEIIKSLKSFVKKEADFIFVVDSAGQSATISDGCHDSDEAIISFQAEPWIASLRSQ